MKYLYGPVQSRRLGCSLGVSVIPYKTCSFDCIYCQLGRTSCQETLRKSWIDAEEAINEIWEWFDTHPEEAAKLDYVTLAGTGEPTLNSQLGEIIDRIREITAVPVALITNASLFADAAVRRIAARADLVVPSLDAASEEVFRQIDRPLHEVTVAGIIEGLVSFRTEYSGWIWLEIMIIKGINDAPEHLELLKQAAGRIRPDKIQLNSPVRAPSELAKAALDRRRLEEICKFFGPDCEVV